MIVDERLVEILGTLYKSAEGDIMLLNDSGAHTVVIEQQDAGMPQRTSDLLYIVSHEVKWGDGETEIWASDLWEDLVDDTKDDSGEEAANELHKNVVSTFQSVILTAV